MKKPKLAVSTANVLVILAVLAYVPWYGYSLTKWGLFGLVALFFGRARWSLVPVGAWVLFSSFSAFDPVGALFGYHPTFSWGVCQLALLWGLSGLSVSGWGRGLLLAASVLSLTEYGFRGEGWHGRLGFPMGSPVYLGHLLAVLSPFLPGSRWYYWLFWGLSVLGTQSRGAVLAAGVGLGYFYSGKAPKWAIPTFLAFGALCVGSVAHLRPAHMSDRGRILTWKAGIEAFKQRPLTGWGPENGIHAITPNRPEGWRKSHDSPMHTQDHAHNGPLNTLMTLGIPGFVLVSLLFWGLWREADRRGRSVLLAFFTCSMFNPVYLAVTCVVFMSVGSGGSRKLAMFLAAVSLAGAVFMARMMHNHGDLSLPVNTRFFSGRLVSG